MSLDFEIFQELQLRHKIPFNGNTIVQDATSESSSLALILREICNRNTFTATYQQFLSLLLARTPPVTHASDLV